LDARAVVSLAEDDETPWEDGPFDVLVIKRDRGEPIDTVTLLDCKDENCEAEGTELL